jgi:hypothetical protein
MGIIGELLADLVGATMVKTVEETLSSDYRKDPVYKKNLERLIEHHRQFEKKE